VTRPPAITPAAVPVARAAPGLRASDADRERVASVLATAAGDGLLTLDEVDERLTAVYGARYLAELTPLTADLPDQRRPASADRERGGTADPATARAALRRHAAAVAVIAVLLVAAWWRSEAPFFWPVWPLAFLTFRLMTHARQVRQPLER